jgi:hypothetical protein
MLAKSSVPMRARAWAELEHGLKTAPSCHALTRLSVRTSMMSSSEVELVVQGFLLGIITVVGIAAAIKVYQLTRK